MGEIGRELTAEEKGQVTGQNTEPEKEVNDEQREEKTVPQKEEVDSSKKEEPASTNADEKAPVQRTDEQTQDLVNVFNKQFGEELGKEFTDEKEIKAFIEKAGDYDNLKTSSDELNQKLVEYQKLAEKADPLSYFVNEDEYIRQQFLKNNKDKLSDEAINALSSLTPTKVNEMKEFDALSTDLIVNKGLTSEEAEAYINKHYDIEEGEELDAGTRAEMKVDVNSAKERLSKMYDGIDVPEKVDWESARQQLKESWEAPLAETIKGLDKIPLAEGVDFVVDDAMKEGLEQEVLSELLANGVKPTEDALRSVVGSVKDRLVLKNMDKVVKSMESDLREKIKSELRKEVHNTSPVNDSSRSGSGNVDRDTAILNAWK